MITGTYPPARCGVGDHSQLLCENLALLGAEVDVITSSWLNIPERDCNPALHPVIRGWTPLHFAQSVSAMAARRADIYHFQFPTRAVSKRVSPFLHPPTISLLRRRSKVVVTFHEPPVVNAREHLLKALGRFVQSGLATRGVNGVVILEPRYEQSLKSSFSRLKKIPFLFSGNASILPQSRLSVEERMALRSQLGITSRQLLLSYIGYVVPPKGFEDIIEVLSLLRGRGLDAYLLVLADLTPQDGYHRRLRELIQQKQLEGHTRIVGYLDRTKAADYLAISDVCLLPFREGVGPKSGTFLASTTQGILTITTSLERRGYVESENAYYVAPGNIPEMADAAQRYGGRRTDGTGNPKDLWLQIAQRHIDFYRQLLSS